MKYAFLKVFAKRFMNCLVNFAAASPSGADFVEFMRSWSGTRRSGECSLLLMKLLRRQSLRMMTEERSKHLDFNFINNLMY